MNGTIVIAISISLCVASLHVNAQQKEKAPATQDRASLTQAHRGLAIRVLSVERKGEKWEYVPGMVYKASEGGELLVVTIEAQPLEKQDGFVTIAKEVTVRDVNNNAYKAKYQLDGQDMELSELSQLWNDASKHKVEIPFALPRGIRLRTLHLDKLSFDIEELDTKAKK